MSRERLLSEVWGYSFDPGSNVVDVCVRRLRKKLGPDFADRDRAACGLPAWLSPRAARLDLALGRACGRVPRGDDRVPGVGDDPVPRDLDQPDAPLRLPGLVDLEDIRCPGGRGDRHRRLDHGRRVRRTSALGRAFRGAADVGDVPRDGLARETPRRSARDRRGARRRARVPARSGRAAAARRLTRAPNAGHDRARPPRAAQAAARRRPARARRSRSTSCSGSSRSSIGSSCSPASSAPTSSLRRRSPCPVPRGRLHALGRGRPARLAPRRDPRRDALRSTRRWLRAALDALLENAVQYTDDHARIESRHAARATSL